MDGAAQPLQAGDPNSADTCRSHIYAIHVYHGNTPFPLSLLPLAAIILYNHVLNVIFIFSPPLLRVFPHPEMRQRVPSGSQWVGRLIVFTWEFILAGFFSRINMISLSRTEGSYCGCGMTLEDAMNCSGPSKSLMLYSPSRTWICLKCKMQLIT